MLAGVNTVKAIDTTRAVNRRNKTPILLFAIGNKDGGTLAGTLAETTRFALVCLDFYANNTFSRKESKQSSYRANTIAIETTANPRHDENQDKCHQSDDKNRH